MEVIKRVSKNQGTAALVFIENKTSNINAARFSVTFLKKENAN